VAVVLVLGGVLAWSLVRERAPRRAKPTDVAAAPSAPAPAVPAAAAAAKPPVAPPPPPPAPPADPTPQAAAAEPVAADEAAPQEPSNAATAVVDPQPPKTAEAMPPEPAATPAVPPSAVAAAPPVADTRVPHGDALAIVAPLPAVPRMPAVDPAPAAGATPPPEEPPSPSAASVSGGPLLRRVGTEAGSRWMVVGRELPLEAREDLLVPLWCRATITIDGIEVVLQPATRCSLARDADGTPRLEVIFGRATVSGRAADARVGVTAAGLSGVLAGMLEAPAAIDVPLDIEPGEQPRRQARLWVGAAEKVWRQTATDGGAIATPLAGVAEEALLAARSTLAWSDRDPAAATIEPPASEPAWIRATAPTDRVERDAVAALAAALAAEPGVAAEEPLEQLASHRRAENRMIAAATLALLGDYGELVAVLSAEPPGALGERQWTVLESLSVPLALARGDNSAAALAEAFAAHGPAGKAETLLRLARGLTADDLASGGDAFLVEALADDSLMVRRYAIRRLEEIVPPDPRRRGGYRADREGTLRDEGIAWWRAQLEQGRIRR
jgi:hypothetical protein